MFKRFGVREFAIIKNYCDAGRFFVYDFNHISEVSFRKTLEWPQYFMWCILDDTNCAQEIFY